MNKYYEINNGRKSNYSYIGRQETENDNIVDSIIAALCAMIAFFRSEGFVTALRVISTVACFIGFVGIIGSVETGNMTVGNGIIFSIFMIFIEIVCFIPRRTER